MKQILILILFFWLVIQACSLGSRWNLIADPIKNVTVIFPATDHSEQHEIKGDLSCDWHGKSILIDKNQNRNELPNDVVIVSQITANNERSYPWRLFIPIAVLFTAYVTMFIYPMFMYRNHDE